MNTTRTLRPPGRPGSVIWVSTSLHTRGGVASYVRTLQRSPLWHTWSARHIATHRDGSATVKIAAFVRGLVSFVVSVLIHRPDLVHLHSSSYGSFARKAIVAALARLFRIPVVLHVHGAEFHLFFDRSPRLLKSVIRSTLTRSAAVIALGDLWAQRLRRIAPAARVVVIPNAVTPVSGVSDPRPGEPVHIVFLGEIGDRKGTFTLLDAWAKARVDLHAGARVTVAGDGELDRAERRISELGLADSVTLRSWLAPADVAELLRSAHVMCLPSRQEGQPMAVLEAMANGLCVVASGVGGIPELLADDSGVLVPPDDVDALAAALVTVVDDPAERSRLGAAALSRASSMFDIEVVWRRLATIYEDVARR